MLVERYLPTSPRGESATARHAKKGWWHRGKLHYEETHRSSVAALISSLFFGSSPSILSFLRVETFCASFYFFLFLCVQACEQVGDWQRALEVCAGMASAGVRLDNKGLLATTRLLDAHGQTSAAARVRRQRYDPSGV